MKNLRFDPYRGTNVPYDSPTPVLTRQLQRLVTEERPGACVGCGFEHNCRRVVQILDDSSFGASSRTPGHGMRTVKPQPARRAATSLPVLFAGLSGGIPLHTLLDRSHNITVEALSCRIGSGLHFLFRGAGVLLKDQVYAVICLCVPLVISSSSCGSQTFIPPFLTFSLYRISCTCASVHFTLMQVQIFV